LTYFRIALLLGGSQTKSETSPVAAAAAAAAAANKFISFVYRLRSEKVGVG